MEPRRFITAFTRALHWFLASAISIQSIPPHPIYTAAHSLSLSLRVVLLNEAQGQFYL
jgi:hypothetical protein